MSGMAAVRATMYSTLMRRNSTYVFVMLLGSYVTTNMYLNGTDAVWKSLNRGVRFFSPFISYVSALYPASPAHVALSHVRLLQNKHVLLT